MIHWKVVLNNVLQRIRWDILYNFFLLDYICFCYTYTPHTRCKECQMVKTKEIEVHALVGVVIYAVKKVHLSILFLVYSFAFCLNVIFSLSSRLLWHLLLMSFLKMDGGNERVVCFFSFIRADTKRHSFISRW